MEAILASISLLPSMRRPDSVAPPGDSSDLAIKPKLCAMFVKLEASFQLPSNSGENASGATCTPPAVPGSSSFFLPTNYHKIMFYSLDVEEHNSQILLKTYGVFSVLVSFRPVQAPVFLASQDLLQRALWECVPLNPVLRRMADLFQYIL